MATTSLFVNYRPLRIGFCVRENNVEDIVRAAELNTLLWGGMYNPIIPIGSNNDFGSSLVKLFSLDLLYPISDTLEITTFREYNDHLQWTNPYDRLLFNQTDRELKMGVLDVSNIINYYWETEFKNIKRSNCVLPHWSKSDPLAAIFTLEFGNYPTKPRLSFNHEVGFLRGLRARPFRIVRGGVVDPELYGKMTPLFLTEDRLILNGGRSWESHGVYLGKPDNPEDLRNFWNIRASGINLNFVPIDDFGRVKSFINKHIDHMQKRDAAERFPRGTGFWYRNELGEEAVKKIGDELIEESQTRVHCRVSETLWNGLNIKPPKTEFENHNILASVDWTYKTPSVSFQLPEKPIKKHLGNSNQDLIVEINPITEHEYEGYTLKLPFLPDLNEWYGRGVTFHPDNLRVGKDEIGVITDVHDSTLTLHPLKNDEIIKRLFLRSQIEAKPSRPGLIAQRLIERMGDLDDCRVFKITGVRRLIASLTPIEAIPHSLVVQKIRDADENGNNPTFDRHQSLYIQPRETPNLTSQDVFDYLLEKDIFTVGLMPACPNCELEFWLSLRDADEQIKCEYCGYEFKIAPQLRHRGDFRFRRSGLFGRADNQEGSIPVILTLLQLLRRSFDRFMYSTGLKLDSQTHGIDCEIDLVVVGKKAFENKVTILIGECKTRDEITNQDIQNMMRIKEIMDSDDVEIELLFSKTSDFTSDEIQRFLPLAARYIYPILFTPRELEPYEIYQYYHDNNITLPHPYTHQFSEMGFNSFDIYLKEEVRSALILHGTGSNPRSNWFPWLKQELEKQGRVVWVPDLPGADRPDMDTYIKYILGNSRFEFDDKTIIIGHSSGAVAILGLLQNLPENVIVDTCILVGSFKDNLGRNDLKGLFEKPFDFKEIKKHAKRFILVHSDNDPYCPLKHAQYLAKKLNGELIVKKGQGHFNLEVSEDYKEFPFILEVIKSQQSHSKRQTIPTKPMLTKN